MKIIFKLLSVIILFLALVAGVFTMANTGALDKQIKLALQYGFKLNGANAKFYNLKFKGGVMTASNLNIKTGAGETKLTNIELHTSFLSNLGASIKLLPTNFIVIDEASQQLMSASIDGIMELSINGIKATQFNLQTINISGQIKDINNKPLEIGSFHFAYTKSTNKNLIESDISFGDSIKLNISNSEKNPHNILLHAENTPILFYKIANKLLSDNKLLEFLNSSIKSGYIKNADVNFNLDTNALSGSAKIL